MVEGAAGQQQPALRPSCSPTPTVTREEGPLIAVAHMAKATYPSPTATYLLSYCVALLILLSVVLLLLVMMMLLHMLFVWFLV